MELKHSMGFHKTAGSKYLVRSSAVPYCNSKYPAHLVVVDAGTQHRLIDQLFSVRLSRKSDKSHEFLRKIIRAVRERSREELEEMVGEDFVKLGDGNISEFQKNKARGIMLSDFPTIDKKR